MHERGTAFIERELGWATCDATVYNRQETFIAERKYFITCPHMHVRGSSFAVYLLAFCSH
jgi:hypothetical protein